MSNASHPHAEPPGADLVRPGSELAAGVKPPEASPKREDHDIGQIVERLSWTPQERFRYFLGMLEFVELARNARRVG